MAGQPVRTGRHRDDLRDARPAATVALAAVVTVRLSRHAGKAYRSFTWLRSLGYDADGIRMDGKSLLAPRKAALKHKETPGSRSGHQGSLLPRQQDMVSLLHLPRIRPLVKGEVV
jgi:hypothetical protein